MNPAEGKLIYIGIPYSHPDKSVTEKRVVAFSKLSARLMKEGKFVFSPIMNHLLVIHADIPGDWEYWQHYCNVFMRRCDSLLIYRIPGWDESIGVAGEIKLATELGLPISYVDPDPEALAALSA